MTLRKAKAELRELRNMKAVFEAKNNPDVHSLDLGTCWMCWVDLTGEWLDKWRYEPFSEVALHKEICPLCGYNHWKGRIWYPFRYKKNYIGNPSERDGIR